MTANNGHKFSREEEAPERFYRVTVPSACEGLRSALREVYPTDTAAPLPDDFARLLRQLN